MLLGVFAGCTRSKPQDTPFAIYNKFDGIRVDIGDKRDDVANLMGMDEQYITLFENENIERVDYWDNEGVSIDYDLATGLVIGMSFENVQWSLLNGLGIGDSRDAVKNQYPDGAVFDSNNNVMYVSFDSDGNVIEFSEDSPYIVWFATDNSVVTGIYVRHWEVYPD